MFVDSRVLPLILIELIEVTSAPLFVSTKIDNLSPATSFVLADQGDLHATLGDMARERKGHTATELPDGRVLLAGGEGLGPQGQPTVLSGWELYDPDTQSFTNYKELAEWPAAQGMGAKRARHTASTLQDGRVLLAGGYGLGGLVQTATDIFDPAQGAQGSPFSPAAPLAQPRVFHSATVLADGRVFVAGGSTLYDVGDAVASFNATLASTEIYDPATDSWSPGPNLPRRLAGHGASLLSDGRVLLTGGMAKAPGPAAPPAAQTDEAWYFDPVGNAISPAPPLATSRAFHSQIATGDGGAMVQGGYQFAPTAPPSSDYQATAVTTLTHLALDAGGASWSNEVIINGGNGWCWFCHGPSEGYAVTWYCGFPCFPFEIFGSDVMAGTGTDQGAPGGAILRVESDFSTVSQIGTTPALRSHPAVLFTQGEDRLLVTGGAVVDPTTGDPQGTADAFVTGSGSEL